MEKVKRGRLLGRGKYSHSTLVVCDKLGFVCTLKEIFKFSSVSSVFTKVMAYVQRYSSVADPHLASAYLVGEDGGKVVVLQEYFEASLHDLVLSRGAMAIEKVQIYLRAILKGIMALHSCKLVHGNLCLQQVNVAGDTCKIRASLTGLIDEEEGSEVEDVQSIGVLGYQMAYGVAEYDLREERGSHALLKERRRRQMLHSLMNQSAFASQKQKELNGLVL